jgi:hypothetical protein
MEAVAKMKAVGWRETSAGRIMMVESEHPSSAIGVENACENTNRFEEIE